MKNNATFERCLSEVPSEIKAEVCLNVDIANHICDMLLERGMTQRDLAVRMGKRESEVSRWLSGTRGFTTATIAKISAALGEPVVEVARKRTECGLVIVNVNAATLNASMPFDRATRCPTLIKAA